MQNAVSDAHALMMSAAARAASGLSGCWAGRRIPMYERTRNSSMLPQLKMQTCAIAKRRKVRHVLLCTAASCSRLALYCKGGRGCEAR